MVVVAVGVASAHAQVYTMQGPQIAHEFNYKMAAGEPQVNTFYFESGVDISPVKGAPYTAKAVTTMTQTLADGNKIKHTSEVDLARDSEGRTRREQTLANLGPWQTNNKGSVITINDPVAHTRYELHREGDKTFGSKTMQMERMRVIEDHAKVMAEATARMQGQGVGVGAGESSAGSNIVIMTNGGEINTMRRKVDGSAEENKNVKTEDLGTQSIEGVSAQGTRKTITIPAGQVGNEQPILIVSETWYSPELKTTVMSKRNDPRVGETEFKLTNIQRVEPDANLFQPPPGVEINEPNIKMRQREF
jgi:hypothetical protein